MTLPELLYIVVGIAAAITSGILASAAGYGVAVVIAASVGGFILGGTFGAVVLTRVVVALLFPKPPKEDEPRSGSPGKD